MKTYNSHRRVHYIKSLCERDHYHIGDWVLLNEKPYRWEYSDYNRSKLGMDVIQKMPITEKILLYNKFTTDDNKSFSLKIDVGNYDITIIYIKSLNACTINCIPLGIKCSHVDELQDLLHGLGLHDIADDFEMPQ